jgi:hypothetical protein
MNWLRDDNDTLWSRSVRWLYLITLALLPWSWFPPFPWLHEHAQWSDVLFAITALAWVIEIISQKKTLRLRWIHATLAGYLIAAALSLAFARANQWTGIFKLLGLAELCALAVITADLSSRPRFARWIARTVMWSSLLVAGAALTGLLLHYAGIHARLIGIYGDLTPSPWYARVQAGTYNPNLLASYCIFAAAVIERDEAELPRWLRRVTLGALWLTVIFTFSRAILGFALAAMIRIARTRSRQALTIVCATGCVAVICALTFWNLKLDPLRPLEARLESNATSPRWQALISSLRTLKQHPLTGSGPGNSPGANRGSSIDAHLTFLNLAATMGLPALTAFAWLLVLLWKNRKRPTDVAVWSGLAGMALDSLAADIEDFRHLWVLFGLADEKAVSRKYEAER